MNVAADIARAARATDRSPTSAQAEAGNYAKGRVVLYGLPIRIETPKGAWRRGVGTNGKPWACKMPAHYGYFERTNGSDGDEVDCYIGPFPNATEAFVIDQVKAEGGSFDEHKCMICFASRADALDCYVAGFSDGKGTERLGKITTLSIDGLKERLKRKGGFLKPTKRARGGRIGYQDGGAPGGEGLSFDDLVPAAGQGGDRSEPAQGAVSFDDLVPKYEPVQDKGIFGVGLKDKKTGAPLVREQNVGPYIGDVEHLYDSGPTFTDPGTGKETHVDPNKHTLRYEGGVRKVYEKGADTYRPWTLSDMGLIQSLWGGFSAPRDVLAGNVAPEEAVPRALETSALAMPGAAPVRGIRSAPHVMERQPILGREGDLGVSPTGGGDVPLGAAGRPTPTAGGPSVIGDLGAEFGVEYPRPFLEQDMTAIRHLDEVARGSEGPAAQKEAASILDRLRAQVQAAGQDVGERIRAGQPLVETPGQAGQAVNLDVSGQAAGVRGSVARAEAEAATEAAAQRQMVEDTHGALGDIVRGSGQPVGSPRETGEVVAEGVRGAAAQARAARTAAYQHVGDLPGEFEAGAFPSIGKRIGNALENRDNPIIVDETTPQSKAALDFLDTAPGLGIEPRKATPEEVAAGSGPTVNEYVPTDLRGVDQARKNLVVRYARAQQAARSSQNYSDVYAMREVMNAFDQHVEDAMANGLFSGDPAALDAMQAARASHARYAQTFRSRDDVGTALRRIVERDATPEETANMIMGSASLQTGLPVRLADRLERVLGPDSQGWSAIRQSLWDRASVVRNARGEVDPARTATSVRNLANSSLGRRVFSPEERAAMVDHANGVEGLEEAIRTSPATQRAERMRTAYDQFFESPDIGGTPGTVFNRMVEGTATHDEVTNAIFNAITSKNPGNVSRMIDAIERISGPNSETMSAIRQGVWRRLTEAPEGKTQPGPTAIRQAGKEFLNGSGREIANRLYDETERGLMNRYLDAVGASEIPPRARTGSDTGVSVKAGLARLAGSISTKLAGAGVSSVLPFGGHFVDYLLGRAVEGATERLGNAASARRIRKEAYGEARPDVVSRSGERVAGTASGQLVQPSIGALVAKAQPHLMPPTLTPTQTVEDHARGGMVKHGVSNA